MYVYIISKRIFDRMVVPAKYHHVMHYEACCTFNHVALSMIIATDTVLNCSDKQMSIHCSYLRDGQLGQEVDQRLTKWTSSLKATSLIHLLQSDGTKIWQSGRYFHSLLCVCVGCVWLSATNEFARGNNNFFQICKKKKKPKTIRSTTFLSLQKLCDLSQCMVNWFTPKWK